MSCDLCRQFVEWRTWAETEPSALRAFLKAAHDEHRRHHGGASAAVRRPPPINLIAGPQTNPPRGIR